MTHPTASKSAALAKLGGALLTLTAWSLSGCGIEAQGTKPVPAVGPLDLDGGAPSDGGARPDDAGPTQDKDAGQGDPADAGQSPLEDAGQGDPDSGSSPPIDASPPPIDAGPPPCPDPADVLDPSCGFQRRIQLTIPKDAVEETLHNFPVPVFLDASRIDYSHLANDARDLRVVDADGALLPYEIERWNPKVGPSVVWVRLPQISKDSETVFWMVFGKPDAAPPDDAVEVWSEGFEGVWHMHGVRPTNGPDSTGKLTARTVGGMGIEGRTPGKVGGALDFDGQDDAVLVDSVNLGDLRALTLGAWVRRGSDQLGRLLCAAHRDGTGGSDEVACVGLYSDLVHVRVRTNARVNPGAPNLGDYTRELDEPDDWTHIAFTWSAADRKVVLYENGKSIGTFDHDGDQLIATTGVLGIGHTRTGGDSYLKGQVDEARFSSVARSAAWIRAEVESARPSWLEYGAEQPLSP